MGILYQVYHHSLPRNFHMLRKILQLDSETLCPHLTDPDDTKQESRGKGSKFVNEKCYISIT